MKQPVRSPRVARVEEPSTDAKVRIVALYEEGLNLHQIAARVGRSIVTVHAVIAEFNGRPA